MCKFYEHLNINDSNARFCSNMTQCALQKSFYFDINVLAISLQLFVIITSNFFLFFSVADGSVNQKTGYVTTAHFALIQISSSQSDCTSYPETGSILDGCNRSFLLGKLQNSNLLFPQWDGIWRIHLQQIIHAKTGALACRVLLMFLCALSQLCKKKHRSKAGNMPSGCWED